MCRMVRAAIAYTTQMMWFQVRCAVLSEKWRSTAASLAFPLGSRQHVIPDVPAPLVDVPFPL